MQGYAHILGLIADSDKQKRTTSIIFIHRGLLPLSECLTLDLHPVGLWWSSRRTLSGTGLCNSRWESVWFGVFEKGLRAPC